MNYPAILSEVEQGHVVRRSVWLPKTFIFKEPSTVLNPAYYTKEQRLAGIPDGIQIDGYIAKVGLDKKLVKYIPTSEDEQAEDWVVVSIEK